LRISRKFELFRDSYRRGDGGKWSGQDLQDATGGVVTRSYVSMLRKGKIENPGFDKLRAIAKAMGFSPELWFEEAGEIGHAARIEQPPKKRNIAGRLNHLFEVIRNERTGEPYANAAQDIARDLADIAGQLGGRGCCC
jgi:transcriptional regulator with XRE-family HTH domain